MAFNAKKILSITPKNSTEAGVLRAVRAELKKNPSDLFKYTKAGLVILKDLPRGFMGDKTLENVFTDMLATSVILWDSQEIELNMRGFKSITHNGFFQLVKKKYNKKGMCHVDSFECEIILSEVSLPNNRSKINNSFPPLKIKLVSSVESLQFKFTGESAALFVLFHLKGLLQSFIKQLPEKLETCYKTPELRKSKRLKFLNESDSTFSADNSDQSDDRSISADNSSFVVTDKSSQSSGLEQDTRVNVFMNRPRTFLGNASIRNLDI